MKRAAFTAVIAIILVVLASLGWRYYQFNSARPFTCEENLRAIGAAYTFHFQVMGEPPTSLESLVRDGFLENDPSQWACPSPGQRAQQISQIQEAQFRLQDPSLSSSGVIVRSLGGLQLALTSGGKILRAGASAASGSFRSITQQSPGIASFELSCENATESVLAYYPGGGSPVDQGAPYVKWHLAINADGRWRLSVTEDDIFWIRLWQQAVGTAENSWEALDVKKSSRRGSLQHWSFEVQATAGDEIIIHAYPDASRLDSTGTFQLRAETLACEERI